MAQEWQPLDNNCIKEPPKQPYLSVPCEIRIAALIDRDYLFLLSDEEVSEQQILTELIGYMADEILLDQSATDIVTVHLSDAGQRIYRRFDLRWNSQGPLLANSQIATSKRKSQFLETILSCSIGLDPNAEE